MKVLLIGNGGVGKLVKKFLEKEMKVICFDVREKEGVIKLNSSLDSLQKKAKKGDIVVNCATTELNEKLLRFCIERELNYFDLGSEMKERKAEQLNYKKEFRKRKLFGIFNLGLSPGLSNLFVKLLHLEGERWFSIIDYEILETKKNIILWNPIVFFCDMEMKPFFYALGKIIDADGMFSTDKRKIPIVGKVELKRIAHDELSTLPWLLNRIEWIEMLCGGSHFEIAKRAKDEGKYTLFVPKMWKKEVSKMEILLRVEGKNKAISYYLRYEDIMEGNVITYPTAFVLSFFIRHFPEIVKKHGYNLLAPEEVNSSFIYELISSLPGRVWVD